jgi:preprotein translocase subunit SecE
MLTQILTVLAALAVPATIIAVVDDWFLRPRRRIAGGGKSDAPLLAANYYLLPLLLIAALLRLLVSERLDFSLVLVTVVAIAGLVWLLDHLLFEPARRRAASAAGPIRRRCRCRSRSTTRAAFSRSR